MRVLFIDFFCGSASFKAEVLAAGFEYFGIDRELFENVNLQIDVSKIKMSDLPDFSVYDRVHIHGSPDCKTYTIAAISHHRNGTEPKSDYAKFCDMVNWHFTALIKKANIENPGKISASIENPRGMMRKMQFVIGFKQQTVWYCQYGDDRAKPTDIWTLNLDWQAKPVCHNGNKNCHHAPAPRGAKTGTQGLKGSYERSKIPNELCRDIVKAIA